MTRVALVLLLLAPALRAQPAAPNVLFVSIDDLNTAVGFLSEEPGNPLQMLYPDAAVRAQVRSVLTPNLDRLAAEGVPFANAHASSAVCAPSRAALMTGVRTSTSGFYGGTWFRFNETLANVATLPEYLRANGYYTAGVGKVYHGNQVYLDTEGNITADFPDAQRSWTQWMNRDIGRAGGTNWSPWSPGVDRLEFGASRRPFAEQNDWLNGDLIARLLETGSASAYDIAYEETRTLTLPADTPFFLAVGLYRPHVPLVVAQEFINLFDPDDMALTDALRAQLLADTEDLSAEGKSQLYIEDGAITDGWTKYLFDHGASLDPVDGPVTAWKELVRHYLASVAQSDRILGRLLDALDASRYADNTIVVVWGDHGWHLGEKAWFGKTMLWDESTRTPLIIRLPSGATFTPGQLRRQPVSLVDVYPTLATLAGLPVPSHAEGADLGPLLATPEAAGVSTALTTMGLDDHAILSPAFRYIRFNDDLGEEELYDTVADPDEHTNLASDPGHAADLLTMRDALDAALVPPAPPENAVTISGGPGYRFLTVGAEGLTISALAAQNLVSGMPGQYEDQPVTLYDRFDGTAWQPATGLATPLQPGYGFFWYFYDFSFTPASTGVGRSVALPFVLTGSGRPALTSDVTVTLHTDGTRYNAFGNPFPVDLDLRAIGTWPGGEHVKTKAFAWDPGRVTWVVGRTAPPWGGFFLRASRGTAGQTLTIPYPTSAKGVPEAEEVGVTFELEGREAGTGRPLFDRALAVTFDADAQPGADDLDHAKLAPLASRYVALGALGEEELLAIDARPRQSGEVALALETAGAESDLTLRWDVSALPAEGRFLLRDVQTGTTVDLRRETRYAFRAASGPAKAVAPPDLREMPAEAAEIRFVLLVEMDAVDIDPEPAFSVAPNPLAHTARVAFDLPYDGEATVTVFDARGREVALLARGYREAGRHVLTWDSEAFAPGVYLVRLEAGDRVLVRRMVVAR